MMYFSGILKAEVTDASEKIVGKLDDILIKPQSGEYSQLQFLVVTRKNSGSFYVPYDQTETISSAGLQLRNVWEKINYSTILPSDCLSLADDVLDQQIVDMGGARVVRANDLRFAAIDNKMCVVGIDVSFRGLLRRLGLLWLDVFKLSKTNLIDWRDAQPVKGALQVGALAENFRRLHPADLANIIEDLHLKRGGKIVSYLDARDAALVLEEMDDDTQKKFLKSFDPARIRQIIENMSTDEVVDLLKVFPKRDADVYLSFLATGRRKEVKKLLLHEDDTAGGLMTTDYVTVGSDWTVAQVLVEIKKRSAYLRSILYVYVIDGGGVLRGTVSLRRLFLSNPEQRVRDIVKRNKYFPTLKSTDDLDEICDVMTRYNLFSAAVLDDNRKLLGVVTIDDVMRLMRPRA